METVMEPQVAAERVQPPVVEKKSLLKRIPKWTLYALLALIVAIALAFGYRQHWFKTGTEKVKEVLSAVMPASTTTTASPQDALTQARQAFATGNVEGAVNGYRELLAKNPDDINALGELGNVLYTSGWIAQATQTYFDAANKAIDQNKPEVAEALLPVIIRGNPVLASQLQDRMFALQSQQMEKQPQAQSEPQPQAPTAPAQAQRS
jgi:cytochrome c-type biogenesis protein CcmH/NrfG